MSIPIFSICKWRYPDYYNVEELPVAGQSYVAEDIYVSTVCIVAGCIIWCVLNMDVDLDWSLLLLA